MDIDRIKRIIIYLKQFKDKERLNKCAQMIQDKVYGKIKARK